jgi:transcriptional regulator with XRE-family HTH domain
MTTDEQVENLTRLLGGLIRVSGQTRQMVERRLGWSGGYLSRLLSGDIDLKVRHVLLICEALAVEPGEFFRMAYAGPYRPAPSPPANEELDRRIRASLAKILGEMKEAGEASGEG